MRNFLIGHGFNHYEISNFSKPTYESKHNSSYWNGNKYMGVGPSAHSFNGKKRQWNIKNNIKYIIALKNKKSFYNEELLTEKDIINEYILTSLRTSKGISLKKLNSITNEIEYTDLLKQMHALVDFSLLSFKQDNFCLTQEGMILCDKITSDLFLV